MLTRKSENGLALDSCGWPWHGLAKVLCCSAIALMISIAKFSSAHAQMPPPSYAPVVVTPPMVKSSDDNFVNIQSLKAQFTIPALKLGDVSFTPYSYNGMHFAKGGIADHNQGRIAQCQGTLPSQSGSGFAGAFECVVANTSNYGIQAIYGEERSTFVFDGSQYGSYTGDGSRFVDNGSTCTWTKRDGTQIVYVAYHDAGNPICKSSNISKIVYPDGRVATYYYYGPFVTGINGTPLLSIVTNTGYMLKYNYSGTPTFSAETSVTAFNRAFESCDPAAVTCTLTYSWPTAKLTFVDKTVTPGDGFPSLGPTYSDMRHYIFTIEDSAHRKHVFEVDSYSRVISYQPPNATAPVYSYRLCSNLINDGLRNCFGQTHWYHLQPFDVPPLEFDMVESVVRNGQTWTYSPGFTMGTLPYNSTWWNIAADPRGLGWDGQGNSTPGTETLYGGSVKTMHLLDGTELGFEWSIPNRASYVLTPAGIKTQYAYDARGNLQTVTKNPVSGSGLSIVTQSANYLATCTNVFTCNKPTWVKDAKNNQTDFTYDPTHGGLLTETDPADASGVRPQKRLTYVQRNAWYLNSSGVMTKDPNPVWVLATESICRKGSAATSGSGCSLPNDEVVTAYDYGPDSGPNNLILRGKTVAADGVTHRSCIGHDKQGNKIWETSPNANPSSCPAY